MSEPRRPDERAGRAPRSDAAEAPRWIRHRPSQAQSLSALGAGLGVGLVLGGTVFYLARLFLAREPLAPAPSTRESGREG